MNPTVTEHVLLSQLALQAFVAHVHERAPEADDGALIDAWRQARAGMRRLEERESGCADSAAVLPLPQAMAAQVAALTEAPPMAQAFRQVPVAFALVEADALMASGVALHGDVLARHQAAADGTTDDDPGLARFCLPLPETAAAHATHPDTHFDGHTWTVVGDDATLRLLQVQPQPAAAATASAPGLACGGLQLLAGCTPPVMHVARHQGRLLLVNGHHRARALRARGVNYLPCLVSACEGLDDVLTAAPQLHGQDLARWFDAPRPPMLRDHDRKSLVYTYVARRLRRVLQVRLDVRSQWLP